MLQSIPIAALILLNVIVIFYVLREWGRTRSGGFLVLNAGALILWAGGLELWRSMGHVPGALMMSGMAPLLIAANMLYFVIAHPQPIVYFRSRNWMRLAVFLPALISVFLRNYNSASSVRMKSIFVYGSWMDFWQAEGGIPFVMLALLLTAATVLLVVRYNQTQSGPDRNLPRHLLLAIVAPSIFVILFSITTSSGIVTIIPSPSLLTALIAQMGIMAVIRQEEIERPLYLSRWIFYSIVVLIGFFISHILYTLYESLTASVLLAPTVRWTVLVTILIVVLAASIPPVQSFFDRLMFHRAYEYRKLVREAQAELYETRQRLRRAERLSVVGEMAARIAHEIKNPLGPIKGYTEMMRERLEKMENEQFPQRESFLRHLSIISEEVENIDERVRHLLNIARVPELSVQSEDINQIAERAALLLRLEAETLNRETPGSKPMTIKEDLDVDLPHVQCSRGRMEESLFNVCRNAFEAAGPGGTVIIRTRMAKGPNDKDGVLIQVEDDGSGFSDSARQHLFEPFFTEKTEGTGLGLSIVKTHMELHKGSIEFHPRQEGGTVAELWLPVESQVQEIESDPAYVVSKQVKKKAAGIG